VTSSLLFVCLFCDISNGAFDKVFKLQVIFMKSACLAVFKKREQPNWMGTNPEVFCHQVLLGGTCLELFFASIFYILLSVLNVAIEHMQPVQV